MRRSKVVLIAVLATGLSVTAFATTITSAPGGGNWSNNAT